MIIKPGKWRRRKATSQFLCDLTIVEYAKFIWAKGKNGIVYLVKPAIA
jgi:hypothetical protein